MPHVGGDPIVESGSNADGEWTRWSDGTQICIAVVLVNLTSTSVQSYPFPASFTTTEQNVVASGGNYDNFLSSTTGNAWAASTANITGNQGQAGDQGWAVTVNSTTGTSVTNRRFNLSAIGRWK